MSSRRAPAAGGARQLGGAFWVAELAQRACEAHAAVGDIGMGAEGRVDSQTLLEMRSRVREVSADQVELAEHPRNRPM